MANPRRTTQSLPLRSVPPHVRAAAATRSGARVEPQEESNLRSAVAWVGLLVFAVAIGFVARWLIYGDALRVQEVRINDLQVVDPIAVSEAARVTGKTLLTVDRAQVAAAVSAVPGVKSVEVRRDWPHAIAIEIVEFQGWGYWEAGGRRAVIDENGRVLDHGRGPASQGLVIYDDTPPATGTAAELEPDAETVRLVQRLLDSGSFSILRVTPTGFSFRRDRGLTVHVASGPAAVFGDAHDFDFKVATWGALLDKVESQRLAVTEIDLRFGKHVVMR